jgi:phage-related protein
MPFVWFNRHLAFCWFLCQQDIVRSVSRIKAALKEFNGFSPSVQEQVKFALQIAAAGEMADIAKPMKGFDAGVFEIAVAYRRDAFRCIYAVKLGDDIWVLHAFQKKSTQGMKIPKHEIDLVHDRIRRLKEVLK